MFGISFVHCLILPEKWLKRHQRKKYKTSFLSRDLAIQLFFDHNGKEGVKRRKMIAPMRKEGISGGRRRKKKKKKKKRVKNKKERRRKR